MKIMKFFLVALLVCGLSIKMNAQFITIDDQKTPQQLIENVLVNSSCASATNTTGKGDSFTPGKNSFAYFNAGTSGFPFSEGIVLTTSTSTEGIGPYVSNIGSGDAKWLGDTDLNQILGINSINATSLEFDFVALTDIISFNYIFASNEYQYSFPCEYSDGFAFLIKEKGSTDPYKNIAVIPNTTTPVSSVNVRPDIPAGTGPGPTGTPYTGCPASNPSYFNGLNNNTSPINYAGQTVVLNAQTAVTTGKTYHIKLVVADADQRYYDSAVFLQAGSFAAKIDFGKDRTSGSNNPLCFGETFLLDPKLSIAYSYKWFKNNVQVATTATYTVTDAGKYRVEVTLNPSTCSLVGEITVDYAPEILSTDTALIQCDDNTDGISVFNLTKADNIVKNNSTEISNAGYYESLANAQSKTNPILNPEKYSNKTSNQIVYARLENKYGCFKIAEVALSISNNTVPNQDPVTTCDKDAIQDGLYQFNLEQQVTPQIILGLPTGLIVHYFLNAADAVTETNQVPNIFKNTIASSQTIYARIINGADCYDIIPITLVVNTFDPANFEDETKFVCDGSQIDLTVAPGFSSYLWNDGNTTNTITVNTAGDYSVTVTNENGCEKTKSFKVILSQRATITNAVIKDFSANENSVLLKYTGNGNYEFSLDGIVFQKEPLFTSVNPGIYQAIARSKDGCGLSNSYTVYVLDYPRFFTPNGDGYNDLWFIKDLNQLPNYTLFIYDRYGKLLKQMNQNSSGWNGLFNGQELPSDDYWFNLTFIDGKIITGHFSLKR